MLFKDILEVWYLELGIEKYLYLGRKTPECDLEIWTNGMCSKKNSMGEKKKSMK